MEPSIQRSLEHPQHPAPALTASTQMPASPQNPTTDPQHPFISHPWMLAQLGAAGTRPGTHGPSAPALLILPFAVPEAQRRAREGCHLLLVRRGRQPSAGV